MFSVFTFTHLCIISKGNKTDCTLYQDTVTVLEGDVGVVCIAEGPGLFSKA